MDPEPTVWIVDDDAKVRKALCALLHAKGYRTGEYGSADEFLDHFEPGRAGCVVTDLRMVGMSGIELQQRLRELCGLLPIIVVTGHADVATTVQIMERGAITLIQKPFGEREILEAIKRALHVNAANLERRKRWQSYQQRLAGLTADEKDVMKLMVEGEPNKAIARRLCISARTCDRRRRSVLDKMGVDSIPQLATILAEFSAATEPSI